MALCVHDYQMIGRLLFLDRTGEGK